ncbi:unnamed protein product [Brachionus calyciflorus]|uniref:LysM domain-containing protein n=1 Tax=Brachionus calyciflorus TaxID=104777 RepID=A0A813X9L9_9BILA|nr:unnamed protein product [Brachionus calyciflorus]
MICIHVFFIAFLSACRAQIPNSTIPLAAAPVTPVITNPVAPKEATESSTSLAEQVTTVNERCYWIKIRRGDTFNILSTIYNIPVSDLMNANPSKIPTKLIRNEDICIPKLS